ncbi:MAG: InlB B-repeat-containing protein [Clostridiales bacterium]|nr:InlB B-repeat-containing protein [Clostridiales bacterium]
MRNALSKVTAWVLTFMMLFTALPVNIIAEGVQPQGIVEERSVDVPAPQQNEEEVSPASAPSEQESIKEQTPVEPQSVIPDDAFYRTYVFMAEEQEVARQIVKNGDTLLQPAAPAKEGYRFDGWYAGESRFTGFGVVTGITATETVTLTAAFTDVFYVFFKNTNGAVVATRSGRNGETISTSGVSFPVAGDEAITGWLLNGTPVDSVTLDGADVTLTAQVSKGFWITFDSKGGSYVAPAFYAQGQTAAAPAAPARPGYVFNGWFTEAGAAADFAAITENTTLVAGWKAGTASYTVIHFLENADDDGYSSKDIETRTGATGSQTAAAAKSYTGFTAQTITQATIAGDGSTIVKVYYTRNVYEVKFYSNSGWISESQEYTSLRITAKYGANISDKWPTYNGSNSWATSDGGNTYQVNIQTMPLGGTSFYGPKTGSGSETAYYYTEILPGESGDVTRNGVTYKLHHKDTSPGTGYTVTKEDKYPITGFTYKEGTRNGSDYDNARFYYTRNSYQIKFINGGSVDKTESRKFQQSIADAEYTPTAPAGKEGYIFAGWYDNEQGEGEQFAFAGKTMLAQNITLYAKWVAPVHTVTFYQEDKVTVVKAVAGIPHGTAMENGDIPAYTPAEGYAFLGWVMEDGSPFNPSMLITRDYHIYARVGSLNAYTVTYDANGGTGDVPVDDGRYAEGAAARVLSGAGLTGPADKPQFLGWALSAEASAPDYYPGSQLILGRENVTLYAVWGVKENTVSLTYHSNFGTDATYTVEALAVNGRVEVLSYDTTGLPARQGYNFLGWSTSASGSVSFAPGSSLRVNAGGSNDLYAVWEPAADTPYRVETYYQQLDGSYLDDPHHAEIRKGTTGTPVSVTEKDKLSSSTDYVFDEGYAGNVLSGVVAADGSLKLKLYFKLNTAPYTIHHYLKGTTVQVAADQTGRLVIGSTLTANAAADLYAEYAAATVNVYDPGRRITITAGNNEIIVYYTLPLTLTAGSAEKVYDGAPLTQPAFTAEGLVNGDTAEKISLSMTAESTITNVGSVSNVIDRTTVQYDGGALPAYYTLTLQPGTLTVTQAEEAVVEVRGGTDTVVYNGSEQSVEGWVIESNPADAIVTLKEGKRARAAGTDVNTYYMGLTAEDFTAVSPNYKTVTVRYTDGWLKITPITDEVTVTITGNTDTVVYNGTEQSVTGYTTDVGEKAIDVTLNQSGKDTAKGTNVGKYMMGLTVADFTVTSGNYSNIRVVVVDGWLEITPASIEQYATLTPQDVSKYYDGTPLAAGTATAADSNGGELLVEYSVDGETWVTDPAGITALNVSDSKTLQVRASGSNYAGYLTGTQKVTINRRPVTLTSATAEKVYDGTPLTDGTVTVSEMGFAQGEGADYSVTGSQLHKGFSANAFTYTLHENTLEENYLIKTVPGTLTVTARPLTITAGSASKQYDGTPLARNSYTSEGLAAGDAIQTVTVTGTITYTGSVPNVPSDAVIHNGAGEDVTGDYEITYNNGTLTITVNEKILKVEANSNSWKYDGENHRDGGYTVIYDGVSYTVAAGDSLTLPTGDKVTVTITAVVKNVSDTAAGNNAIVKLDLQHADQYKIKEEKDGTLTITARKLTLTSGSDEKEYDGTPLTSKVVDVTGDGFVKGEGAQFDVTGSQTEAGESDNTFTYTLNRNTLAENYEITPVLGSLTVTRRGAGEKKVKIIANSYTVEYDGRFHGANGYTTEYLAPGHKVKKLILAGGRTDAGEYPGEFVPYDAAIVDANGNDVTHNYVITYVAGDLTITKRGLDPKNPVIVRADNSEVEYDGQPHGYVGHTASNLAEGHSVQSVESSFTATEAGYYEAMIDVSDAVIVDANGNDVTRNYAITYIFGNLRITKRGAGERKVLIIARDNTVEYDGQPHGQNGFDTDYLAPGHRVADVTIDGEKINAGRYADLMYPHDAVIVDAEGNDVTHNYKLTYVKGTLEITPYAGEVVVTITGNHDRVHYDGEEHTVSGYTVDIDTALYTEADFRFKGTASVTKVYPGTYAMGLQEKDFVNLNENLANVKFVVTDGYLEIYTKKFMVAWMYDTNQMVNGSQPSEAFTAMTDYIHRKDVSLVLHTGNMVENAADAGQWKVFNDAMQKLYDDAGKDVLMVAGEKEAAAGSLFLQQPVREGFDEKDLFEGGKGFVYRFRIGDKRMILVGLGEDAMTEEGLKWAKERFDSDKKAVGILMVHTYLLADMTQKQKIADSALKLEENVVKPCSNVRLVLSSNAGYASHHYFYYGMRKTTAINVDIEAAAKEGYFTMLTFDKDFHYVAVNSLSPYRNDYIYNDEKAELERYHLGELY